MARTVLEELKFILSADSAQVRRELGLVEKRGDQAAGRLRASFLTLNRALGGLGLALGASQIVRAAQEEIDFGDALKTTAQATRVGVEALQELRFAAEQAADITSDRLDTGLKRWVRGVGAAANGTGELRKEFERYGIQLQDADGNLKSSEALLREYADAVKGAASPQEQLRLAVVAFGRENGQFVNLLRQGADGLDGLAEAARRAGVVLGKEAVERLSEADDRLKKFNLQWQVLKANLVAGAINLIDPDLPARIRTSRENVAELTAEVARLQKRSDELRASGRGGPATSILEQTLNQRRRELETAELLLQSQVNQLPKPETAKAPGTSASPRAVRTDAAIEIRDRELDQANQLIEALQRQGFEAQKKQRLTVEAAGEELAQQERLLAALQQSEAAYEATAAAIAAENAVKAAGLDLDSEIGRQLYEQVEARSAIEQQINQMRRASEDEFKAIKDVGVDAAQSLGDAFADFAIDGELSLDRIGRAFARNLLSNELTSLLSALIPGFGPGQSVLASLFGRAGGGRTVPGQAYIVGENRRPELFVPDVAGQIVPMRAAAGGGAGAVVNIAVHNNSNARVGVTSQQVGPSRRDIQLVIEQTTNEQIRNGSFDAALSRRFALRPVGH